MSAKTKALALILSGAAASLLGFGVGVPGLASLSGELNIAARNQKGLYGFFVFLGVVGLLLLWQGISAWSVSKKSKK